MNPAESYILNQPEPYKTILLHLQMIIEAAVPNLELKCKWSLPYYYLEGNPFCYLNVTKGYVDVAFRYNDRLKEHDHLLVGENRKVMKSLRYYSLNDIDQAILTEVLLRLKK